MIIKHIPHTHTLFSCSSHSILTFNSSGHVGRLESGISSDGIETPSKLTSDSGLRGGPRDSATYKQINQRLLKIMTINEENMIDTYSLSLKTPVNNVQWELLLLLFCSSLTG